MSPHKTTRLADRGIVRVSGEDAEKLLQGVITNDMDQLGARNPALYSALLSPQGKILFDFFVIDRPEGYLLDTPRHEANALTKRLSLYKLRADVTIENASDAYTVIAHWTADAENSLEEPNSADCYTDPRHPMMGHRILITAADDPAPNEESSQPATHEDYDALRIAHGIPEGTKDFAYGDTFPHEALLDQLRGVSFTKGCYVGQEVVSRMHHRSTARKRIVPISASTNLPPPGTIITSGNSTIGVLGTVAANRGLALLRLDRASEARQKGNPVHANGIDIEIALPDWATFTLASPNGSAQS